MSCKTNEVKMIQGSVEYLYADIRTDRVLDTQAVALSISDDDVPTAWIPAEWTGSASKFRSARILLSGTLPTGLYHVFARITDMPEAPIILVGRLRIV